MFLPAVTDLCLQICFTLFAAQTLADCAVAWGLQRAKMFGRYVLRGQDSTLRRLNQFRAFVKLLSPKHMFKLIRRGEWINRYLNLI